MALLITATVLAFFAVDTLENAPETFVAIIAIGVLAVAFDAVGTARAADRHLPDPRYPMTQPSGQTPGVTDAPQKHARPWGWIAACVVLVIVAGGLAIWALGTQSDLDAQKDQTAQAQQEAQKANDQMGAMQDQLNDVTQSVDDASDQLAQAGDEASSNIDAALEGIKTKLAALKRQDRARRRRPGGNGHAVIHLFSQDGPEGDDRADLPRVPRRGRTGTRGRRRRRRRGPWRGWPRRRRRAD